MSQDNICKDCKRSLDEVNSYGKGGFEYFKPRHVPEGCYRDEGTSIVMSALFPDGVKRIRYEVPRSEGDTLVIGEIIKAQLDVLHHDKKGIILNITVGRFDCIGSEAKDGETDD